MHRIAPRMEHNITHTKKKLAIIFFAAENANALDLSAYTVPMTMSILSVSFFLFVFQKNKKK